MSIVFKRMPLLTEFSNCTPANNPRLRVQIRNFFPVWGDIPLIFHFTDMLY